jgi:hypothetical protein
MHFVSVSILVLIALLAAASSSRGALSSLLGRSLNQLSLSVKCLTDFFQCHTVSPFCEVLRRAGGDITAYRKYEREA